MNEKLKIGFQFQKSLAWELFLVIAFPIHIWALFQWFLEFETIAQRTNTWDAVGLGGYILAYALFESLAIFVGLWLLLLLLPKRTEESNVFAVVTILYLALATWFILEQARFLPLFSEDVYFIWRVRNIKSFTTPAGTALTTAFVISILVPPILMLKFEKLKNAALSFVNRLTMLTTLYLVLDAAAIILIVIRNF